MVFSFFTKSERDKSLALLIDIGSASVGCSLARIEKDRAPHILLSVREDIPFQESLSSAKFLLAMNRTLERALKSVQEGMKKPGLIACDDKNVSNIFCTLSSPWFILKSRNLRVSRLEPFKVTERILGEFMDSDIENLKEELKSTFPSKDVAIIEKNVIQVKLNGYDIKNPYGHTTSQLEISMTVSLSSKKVIHSIEQRLGQFPHTAPVHFGVFPISAFSAVRDIFPVEKNFIFLDVTGEATDVSRSANDLLVGTVAFPRGKNFFIREISTQLSTIHEEASTLFSMFLRKELSSDKHLAVEAIVSKAGDEWVSRLEKAIQALSENEAVPHKVFYTTDSDVAGLFSWLMSKVKKELLLHGPFDVQYIDKMIVSSFVTFEPEVVRDPFIVIEALLAEKIVSQHT